MDDQLAYKLCCPIPMTSLRCSLHKPANISKVCSEVVCQKKPLMCSKCALEDVSLHGEHSGKIIDLDRFIPTFSQEMFRLSDQNKRLYSEFLDNKENVSLLQLLEQGDIHLKTVEDKVIRQKQDLIQDMTLLQERIQTTIQTIRNENLRKLDDFFQQYKQSFNTLKENIDSFFLLSRKNFFYSNTNTFQQKLASLPPPDAQTLIKTLKHHLNLTKTFSAAGSNATPLQMLSDLQTLAKFLQKMTGSPPNYDQMSGQEYQGSMMEGVVREVGQVLSSVISGRLFVPVGGQKDNSQVGTGDHSTQIQVDARNSDEFFLKPSKKYQLDFPVQTVLALTESVFVMGSANDAIIRIFDTQQKKIFVYTGHSEPIIYLECILTDNKTKQFVSLSSDKQIIVWSFDDISISIVPKIVRRIILTQNGTSVLDMKDQTHLAVSDVNKEISVANMLNSKVGNFGKTRHLSNINGLVLLKKGERFISYSGDSIIIIWRIVKAGGPNQEPVIICDQTLHDPLYGTICQIFITTQWTNQAIIVNAEGEIKIFDMTKNCVVFSQFGKKKLNSTFIETILIEEADRKLAPTNWLIAFSYNDNAAIQHRLTNSPFTMHSQDIKLEHKLVAQQASAVKHKVQLFQTGISASASGSTGNAKLGSMLLMFASEANQELLVYELKGK